MIQSFGTESKAWPTPYTIQQSSRGYKSGRQADEIDAFVCRYESL
jgi:hypothetical protein